ncbi:MAG: FAD:protein FMN transferase, partial [Pseudomonadales bacterium]|nr:FAD:protein FMN transferase [Pseudomonadales bacterium]
MLVRPSGGIQQLRGYTMGTTYRIQIVDMPAALSSSEIAADVSALLLALDTGIFSTYAANSELSRFNRAPLNQPFAASAELLAVLTLAKEISELSDGAFDVTVGGLVNLWGFGPSILALEDDVPEQ